MINKIVLLPDIHYPHHNKEAVSAVFQFIKWFRPHGACIMGDALNMDAINHWKKAKGDNKYFENKRLQEDYDGFDREILTPLEKLLPRDCEKVFMGGNHECLDSETELLTKRGWVNYKDINKENDKVLSHTLNGLEWVDIDKLIIDDFDGYLNRIKTITMDLLATDNHRIYYHPRPDSKKCKFVFVKDLTKSRYRVPVSGILDKPEYDIPDDIIRIVAWLLTDGHIEKNYGYIRFYQSGDKHLLITKILDGLNFQYTISKRQRNTEAICGIQLKSIKPSYTIRLSAEYSRKLEKYIKQDKLIPDWAQKLNKRQFDIFLSCLIDGDGSRHKSAPETSLMLYGKKDFLDEIQALCIQNGHSSNLSTYREKDYRLNICPRRYYSMEAPEVNQERYIGEIWDLVVKNHNFLVRRNGKAYFTGNSWINIVIGKDPNLEGMIEPEIKLRLKERDWEWIPYIKDNKRGIKRYGKLLVFHGQYTNKYHSAKIADTHSRSCAYGHCHDLQLYTKVFADDQKDFHTAQSIGCLCTLSPEFMKGRMNRWVNAFGILYVREDGLYNLYVPVIIKGKFTFAGKTFGGKS